MTLAMERSILPPPVVTTAIWPSATSVRNALEIATPERLLKLRLIGQHGEDRPQQDDAEKRPDPAIARGPGRQTRSFSCLAPPPFAAVFSARISNRSSPCTAAL